MDPKNRESSPRHNSQSIQPKKRRSRVSTGERNHICGCNKHYLSYPALYTHVKLKHNGVFPQGSLSKKHLDHKENQLVKSDGYNNEVERAKLSEDIKSVLERTLPANVSGNVFTPDKLVEIFPKIFFNREDDYKPILQLVTQSQSKSTKSNNIKDITNPEFFQMSSAQHMLADKDKYKKLDIVLAQFIIYYSSFVNRAYDEYVQEFIIVCLLMRKCLLEQTDDFLGKRKAQDKSSSRVSQDGSAENSPDSSSDSSSAESPFLIAAPRIANKFVVEDFPEYARKLKKYPSFNL